MKTHQTFLIPDSESNQLNLEKSKNNFFQYQAPTNQKAVIRCGTLTTRRLLLAETLLCLSGDQVSALKKKTIPRGMKG